MTDASAKPNPYLRFLLIGGVVAIVAGGLVAIVAKSRADSDAFSHLLYLSMGGVGEDNSAATGFMWFGIAVLVLGVAMILGYVIIRASKTVPPAE